MNWCVSLLALVPFQALLSFFFHVCGGWEVVLPPSHIHPCPEVPPFPSSPYMRQRKGRGLGGQGSPSVLRLHRVFRLNQENFYYQKEKKKKKRKTNPSGHLSSLPHWDSQDWICGVPGRVAQGWNTLRQEWWSPLAGPPPGPLWASPLSPLLSPSKRPTRGGLPLPPGPWGPVGVRHSPGEGGRWDPGSLHTVASAPLPQSWASPSMSCCGDARSLLRSLCHPLPPLQVEGGADPSTGRGEGRAMGRGLSAPRGQLGNRDTSSPFWESPSESTAPHRPLLLPLPWH